MNARLKAIKWLLKFKFKNKFKISEESDDFIINESDCYKAIDIAIQEVIDDYEIEWKKGNPLSPNEMRKRHLSTFPKEKRHNNDFIQDLKIAKQCVDFSGKELCTNDGCKNMACVLNPKIKS